MTPPHAPTTARALATAEVCRRIVAESRRQLAEVGPAALSLRAVSRELGMAPSAIYRHFADRDALLSALIAQTFTDLGEAVEVAVAAAGPARIDTWRAWTRAVREWAVARPFDYALVYGSPVPGYAAPRDTVAPAVRVLQPILDMASGLTPSGSTVDTPPLGDSLDSMADYIDAPAEVAARAIEAWATIMGFLSLYLFGHLVGAVDSSDTLWERVVEQTAADLGLTEPDEPLPGGRS
jgi:AcrR family transcriptional regulator